MVARMISQPSIDVATNTSFSDVADRARFNHVIYTGPIDEYFGYVYGRLPYRSLQFSFETLDREWAQTTGCVNEPSAALAHTRTTEYKHLTGQTHAKTILSREYPSATGEPYYPIPRPENKALYERYARLAAREPNVTFVGRLAEYRYYNMDQAVASALATFNRLANTAMVAS
jgi:UDP-galactopyranose mutase